MKLHTRHYITVTLVFLSGLRAIAASKCENDKNGTNFLGTCLTKSFRLLITRQELEKLQKFSENKS